MLSCFRLVEQVSANKIELKHLKLFNLWHDFKVKIDLFSYVVAFWLSINEMSVCSPTKKQLYPQICLSHVQKFEVKKTHIYLFIGQCLRWNASNGNIA